MKQPYFEPLDPQVQENPYPYYARLRRDAPVYRIESSRMWAVSRYADALWVLTHPDVFSSVPYAELIDAAMALGDRASLAGESLLGTDPPAHTRLRKIVNRGFTRERIAAIKPRIRRIADELIDGFIGRGTCDLAEELAMPVPVMIIAEILGIDPHRRSDFKRWSDDLLIAVTGQLDDEHLARLSRSFDELDAYVGEIVEDRRRNPRHDLISALIRAEGDEEVMSGGEIFNFINLLLIAGNEATTNLIGNIALALVDKPSVMLELRDDPTLAAGVVEETLRYDSPVQLVLRRAMRDVEIAGARIAAGEDIAVLIGSANRDERQFRDAESFDPGRERPSHLTFGHGTHFCIGAHLARLEATIALQALVARIENVVRTDAPIERPPSWLVRGPKRLELRFEAAPDRELAEAG